MSFQIRINGKPFELWKSAVVQRSIDGNAGSFRFSTSSAAPISNYPAKTGDFVEITIDNRRTIAGWIDEISGSQDEGTHNIEVSGRDTTADLIDSSVPDAAKVTIGPIGLKALVEKVISSLGASIKVSSNVTGLTDFTNEDLQAAGSGSTCIAYLVSFARKRQVYLVSDGSGGIIIYRPDAGNLSKSPLIHTLNGRNNNVISYSFTFGQQQRFYKYLCRSQDNFGFSFIADYLGTGTDRKNDVVDDQIRKSRYKEIQAEETMDDAACLKRASEESNIRRAGGTTYTATVAGATQADGTLWDFGQFVKIIDDYAGISGTYLIKSVEFAIDVNEGTRTQLTCTPPDAYQVTAQPTAESKRSARTQGYQNETPPARGTVR